MGLRDLHPASLREGANKVSHIVLLDWEHDEYTKSDRWQEAETDISYLCGEDG